MSIFENLPHEEEDAIFALGREFRADSCANKVNLGVGVYYNEEGNFQDMKAVAIAAEKYQYERCYQPIDGDQEYISAVQRLVLGNSYYENKHKLYGAQTLGGTGALYFGAKFLKYHFDKPIYIPSSTWSNHINIFDSVGSAIYRYPYLNSCGNAVDWEAMQSVLLSIPVGSIVLFHGCCHNPTGIDLTYNMWDRLAEIVKERQLLPFFDLAYQGFGEGVESDTYAIKKFADENIELLVACSSSKNFSVYGERVGMLMAIINDADTKKRFCNNLKKYIRTTYSSPPRHGAYLVKTVLNSKELYKIWLEEVDFMRNRIVSIRFKLSQLLKQNDIDFSFIESQRGMFSIIPLSVDKILKLKKQYSIYMLENGRINIAGLNMNNINYVVKSFSDILKP